MQVMCPRCRKRMKISESASDAKCNCGYHFTSEELVLIRHLESELAEDLSVKKSAPVHEPPPAAQGVSEFSNEETKFPPDSSVQGILDQKLAEFLSEREDFSDIRYAIETSTTEAEQISSSDRALFIDQILESEKSEIARMIRETFPEIDSQDIERQVAIGEVFIPSIGVTQALTLADQIQTLHCVFHFGLSKQMRKFATQKNRTPKLSETREDPH